MQSHTFCVLIHITRGIAERRPNRICCSHMSPAPRRVLGQQRAWCPCAQLLSQQRLSVGARPGNLIPNDIRHIRLLQRTSFFDRHFVEPYCKIRRPTRTSQTRQFWVNTCITMLRNAASVQPSKVTWGKIAARSGFQISLYFPSRMIPQMP